MALAPLSRTIILYEGGANPRPTEPIAVPVAGTPTPTPVPPTPPPPPTFASQNAIQSDGTPQVGEELTGTDATVQNQGSATLARAWVFGGNVVATGVKYTPTQTGTLTYRNQLIAAGGTTILDSVTVQVTVTAANAAPAIGGPPGFSGVAQSGQTLSGTRGTYTGAPTSFADQWQASADNGDSWSAIAGATALDFAVTDAEVGKLVRRREIATNAFGSAPANFTASSATIIPAGSEVQPTFGRIDVDPQADPTVYPPAPFFTFVTARGYKAGDHVRIQASSSPDFSALTINDATVQITTDLAAVRAALNARLAGITAGTTWLRYRAERSASLFGAWSYPVLHGTAAVPALTTGPAFVVRSKTPLVANLTYAGPINRLEIYGDDMLRGEIAPFVPGTAFVLRFADNATKDYDVPTNGFGSGANNGGYDDFDLDRQYKWTIRAYGANGRYRDDAVTATVQDYDTIPDQFALAPTTGANRNTQYARAFTAPLAGFADDYDAPTTISGPFDDFRVHDGTSWGGYRTSQSGLTLRKGWNLEVRATSSPNYLTDRNVTVNVASVEAVWQLQTMADPAVTPVTIAQSGSVKTVVNGSGTSLTLPLTETGLLVLIVASSNYVLSTTVGGAATTGGVASDPSGNTRPREYGAAELAMFTIPLATAGNKTLNVNFGGYTRECVVSYTVVKGADPAIPQISPGASQAGPNGEASLHETDVLVIPQYGRALGACVEYAAPGPITPGGVAAGTTLVGQDWLDGGGGEAIGLIVGQRIATGKMGFTFATDPNRQLARIAIVFKPQGT